MRICCFAALRHRLPFESGHRGEMGELEMTGTSSAGRSGRFNPWDVGLAPSPSSAPPPKLSRFLTFIDDSATAAGSWAVEGNTPPPESCSSICVAAIALGFNPEENLSIRSNCLCFDNAEPGDTVPRAERLPLEEGGEVEDRWLGAGEDMLSLILLGWANEAD